MRRFCSGGAASGIWTRDVLAFKSLPERKECPSGSHNGWRTEGSSARPSWAQRCRGARSELVTIAAPWLPEGHLFTRRQLPHTSLMIGELGVERELLARAVFVKPQISSVQIPFGPCVCFVGPRSVCRLRPSTQPSPTRVSRSLHYSLCLSPTSVEDPSEEKIKTTVLAAASLHPAYIFYHLIHFTLVPISPHKYRQHADLHRESRHFPLDCATEGGALGV